MHQSGYRLALAFVFDCGDPIVMLSTVTTRPAKVPNDLPRAVRNALMRALGKEPGKRFDNCRQFVDALRPPVPPPPVFGTVVVALVLIVAIGTGAVVWHRHHQRLAQIEELRRADEARQEEEAEKKRQAEAAEKRRREELAAKAEQDKSDAEARAKAAAERKRQEEAAAA